MQEAWHQLREAFGPGTDGTAPVKSAERTRYFYLGPDLALTRLRNGQHLYVDPQDDSISAHMIAHGFWEPWIGKVVAALVRPGDTVVEVGANVGYYTLMMAGRVGPTGSVTALEANPRLANLVRRSLLFNGHGAHAQVIGCAAMDRPGTIGFVTSRSASGGGHTQIQTTELQGDRTLVDVQAVRLDDLGLETVDFIRIDAEGSEPLILRGAERLLRNPDLVICMEWSVMQMRSRAPVPDFVDWLTAQGFRFWEIDRGARLVAVSAVEMLSLHECDVVVSRSEPSLRRSSVR